MTVFTDSLRKLVQTVGKSADVSGDAKPNDYKWAAIELNGQMEAMQRAAEQRAQLVMGDDERDPATGQSLDGEEADQVARVMQMSDLDQHANADPGADLARADQARQDPDDRPDRNGIEQERFFSTLVLPQLDGLEPEQDSATGDGPALASADFGNFNRLPDGTLASPIITPHSFEDLQRIANIMATWPEITIALPSPAEPPALDTLAQSDLAESIKAVLVDLDAREGGRVAPAPENPDKGSEAKPPEMVKDRDFDIDL